MNTVHLFVIVRPGHDLDGEAWAHRGTEDEAFRAASEYVDTYRQFGVTVGLQKVGVRVFGKFTPCVPANELPWWLKESA